MSEEDILWFAMSATFGRELKAKDFLEKNDVECFVPMRYEMQKNKKDEQKRQLVSAINNLIFVHTTRNRIQDLKSQVQYLHYLVHTIEGRNIPIVVPEHQMTQFITVCNTYNEKLAFLSPDEVYLDKGTRIRIVGGALDGIEGTFVKVARGRKKKIVVMVEGIIGVAMTEITDGFIQVVET